MIISTAELKIESYETINHENMLNSILDSKRWLSHKHKLAYQGNMEFFCIIPLKIFTY